MNSQGAPPPPPPACWYPADRAGFERWWDGFRWTDHVRPTTPPQPAASGSVPPGSATSRPTVVVQLERIKWAGVAWGGHGGSALSTGFGVLFVLISLPPLLFALTRDELWRAVFMVAITLVPAQQCVDKHRPLRGTAQGSPGSTRRHVTDPMTLPPRTPGQSEADRVIDSRESGRDGPGG